MAVAKDPFIYRDWLDEFRREVDDQLERLRKAPVKRLPPGVPPAKEAAEAFTDWWRGEFVDPAMPEDSLSTLQTNKELEVSRQEVAALKAELARLGASEGGSFPSLQEQIRLLSEERARLAEQLRVAQQENASLKELKATIDDQLGALRLRLATLRGEYDAKARLLQDQVDSMQRRAAALEAEAGRERELRLQTEKQLQESRERLAQSDALRSELAAMRGEVETKLETAAEFLEMKIRSVQDQSKGQAHQLRELVEALRRFREQS